MDDSRRTARRVARWAAGFDLAATGLLAVPGLERRLVDVLMQIDKERTGRYAGPDYFTID